MHARTAPNLYRAALTQMRVRFLRAPAGLLMLAAIGIVSGFLAPSAQAQSAGDSAESQRFLPWVRQVDETGCASFIHLQYVGQEPSIVMLFYWAAPAGCGAQASAPVGLTCSGLLNSGGPWVVATSRLPQGVESAAAFTLRASDFGDPSYARLCESMRARLLAQDATAYADFKAAYDSGGTWQGFPMDQLRGGPLQLQLQQDCIAPAALSGSIALRGIGASELKPAERQGDRWIYRVPLWFPSEGRIHLQNAGSQCARVEGWVRLSSLDCGMADPQPCLASTTLAPGSRISVDLSACLTPGAAASLELWSNGPLAIASEASDAPALHAAPGQSGPILQAPLAIDIAEPWVGRALVQNMDGSRSAFIRLHLLDRQGRALALQEQVLCPAEVASIALDLPAGSPSRGNSLLVESLAASESGGAEDPPPISGIIDLHRASPGQQRARYAMQAFDPSPGAQVDRARLGLPLLRERPGSSGRLSIHNQNLNPGFTQLAIYLWDRNGLLDFFCVELRDQEVAAIELASWKLGSRPGMSQFQGSAVISASHWEHPAFDPQRGMVNDLRLAATFSEHPVADSSTAEAWAVSASGLPTDLRRDNWLPRCPVFEPGGPEPPPTVTPELPVTPAPTVTPKPAGIPIYLPVLLRR